MATERWMKLLEDEYRTNLQDSACWALVLQIRQVQVQILVSSLARRETLMGGAHEQHRRFGTRFLKKAMVNLEFLSLSFGQEVGCSVLRVFQMHPLSNEMI